MDKKYKYDRESDALYVYIQDGLEDRFEEIAPGINMEFDKQNNMLGIEVLKASRFYKDLSKRQKAQH